VAYSNEKKPVAGQQKKPFFRIITENMPSLSLLSEAFLFLIINQTPTDMAKKFIKHSHHPRSPWMKLMERGETAGDSVPIGIPAGRPIMKWTPPTIGERPHIQKLIKDGLLSPVREKEALFKKLG
jgi:hypothetical protein